MKEMASRKKIVFNVLFLNILAHFFMFSSLLKANECEALLINESRISELRPEDLDLPNAPLDMPKQIITQRVAKLSAALNTTHSSELVVILINSELVLSDFLNEIIVKNGDSVNSLTQSSSLEIEAKAKEIYNVMSRLFKSKEFLKNVNLYDPYFSQETFVFMPKELMIHILMENLKMIAEDGDFSVYHHPHIFRSLRKKLKSWYMTL